MMRTIYHFQFTFSYFSTCGLEIRLTKFRISFTNLEVVEEVRFAVWVF